jgi:hypothetical protein
MQQTLLKSLKYYLLQVELLDERSKQYSFAGDDNVSGAIADLVRGVLCPAIK